MGCKILHHVPLSAFVIYSCSLYPSTLISYLLMTPSKTYPSRSSFFFDSEIYPTPYWKAWFRCLRRNLNLTQPQQISRRFLPALLLQHQNECSHHPWEVLATSAIFLAVARMPALFLPLRHGVCFVPGMELSSFRCFQGCHLLCSLMECHIFRVLLWWPFPPGYSILSTWFIFFIAFLSSHIRTFIQIYVFKLPHCNGIYYPGGQWLFSPLPSHFSHLEQAVPTRPSDVCCCLVEF